MPRFSGADQVKPLSVVLIKSAAVLTPSAVNTVWFSLLISGAYIAHIKLH